MDFNLTIPPKKKPFSSRQVSGIEWVDVHASEGTCLVDGLE